MRLPNGCEVAKLTLELNTHSIQYVTKTRTQKNDASSKKLLTSIKEKGPLGKKSPFTRKEKGGSEDILDGGGSPGACTRCDPLPFIHASS